MTSPEQLEIVDVQFSKDWTRKIVFRLTDGALIESVLIPTYSAETKQVMMTLCLSTQVGCAMACTFCNTGLQGLSRNLSSEEIISQILTADKINSEHYNSGKLHFCSKITNIVYMGMGEPLHNLNPLLISLRYLTSNDGMGINKNSICVSTSGLVGALDEFNSSAEDEIRARLAVSLNAPNDELRNSIMPVNRSNPLGRLIDSLKRFKLDPEGYILFEYVLIEGINDDLRLTTEIAELIKGVPSKVNLIPFNEFPGGPYRTPSKKAVNDFQTSLQGQGIKTTLRRLRGYNVLAACGMLVSSRKTEHFQKRL